MSAIHLHPQLGKPEVREIAGEQMINAAGVAEIARKSGTPQGRALYRAYIGEWRRLEGSSLSKADRELRCIQAGLNAVARLPKVTP